MTAFIGHGSVCLPLTARLKTVPRIGPASPILFIMPFRMTSKMAGTPAMRVCGFMSQTVSKDEGLTYRSVGRKVALTIAHAVVKQCLDRPVRNVDPEEIHGVFEELNVSTRL